MRSPIIDRQTGAFFFNVSFSISKGTAESEIVAWFDLDETVEQPIHPYALTYRTVQNVEIKGFYLNILFTFKDSLLECLQFDVNEQPLSISSQGHLHEGWNYSDKEKQKLVDYDIWLTQQLGKDRAFHWGKIDAMWQPLGNGPIIYLEYS